MAGEHDDAISRVDDLIHEVPFVSICYVVQVCAESAIKSPLTWLTGIHASSSWKIAYGEQRLHECSGIFHEGTRPNTTSRESSTLDDLTSKFANWPY